MVKGSWSSCSAALPPIMLQGFSSRDWRLRPGHGQSAWTRRKLDSAPPPPADPGDFFVRDLLREFTELECKLRDEKLSILDYGNNVQDSILRQRTIHLDQGLRSYRMTQTGAESGVLHQSMKMPRL